MRMMKAVVKAPVRFVDSVADRIVAILGAVALSEFPAYINNYVQRLGGHVDEAALNVRQWQLIADRTTDGSLSRLVQTYESSRVPAVVEAGEKAANDIARLEYLNASLDSITHASVWEKPFVFFRHLDLDIAHQAVEAYVPNIPTNAEGLVYAGVGLLVGMAVYAGFKYGANRGGRFVSRKFRRRPESASA